MNANIVYSVVKALPEEEQHRLFTMLQSDINTPTNRRVSKKKKLITRAEADAFILKHVFGKKLV